LPLAKIFLSATATVMNLFMLRLVLRKERIRKADSLFEFVRAPAASGNGCATERE
jgi:hypothetical protein